MTEIELSTILAQIFEGIPWPKPLNQLEGARLIRTQKLSPEDAAKQVKTSKAILTRLQKARYPTKEVLGLRPESTSQAARTGATRILGQLLLGRCAEVAFEHIYKREMHTEELELRDLREGRTDTDYRLYNSQQKPVYRINIKFHGARFRRAKEFVGLEPEDCFALATYKIDNALRKQDEERLPYIFAIVGVRDISAETVGQQIPEKLTYAVALMHEAPKAKGKRYFEERVVEYLVRTDQPVYQATFARIAEANWYILSARRADKLLREKLFERVFALRVRNFARVFGGAELDMHFSISQELTPLHTYLRVLREEGSTSVTTRLESGEF
jgi:hypothetical protein